MSKPPPSAGIQPHLVVLGCGFGGLALVQALRRAPVAITVVDRSNHHLFQPLLYQVATAALNPSDIASPIRRILRRQQNVKVLLAEATGIDLEARRVQLADGELNYDLLALATGSTHSYFGHDDWKPHAPGLKSITDALEIRRRMLSAFEYAEREPDLEVRRAWLTFVIVGGGPTGVELAGTLADVARKTLASDFDEIDPTQARILLVESSAHVLDAYDPKLSRRAREQLEELGVEVRTGSRVTEIDADGVAIGSERVATRTVLWAAGVAASPLGKALGVPVDRAGRVLVEPDLSVPGHPEVFVIGDLAHVEQDGRPVPGVAPAANQMGELVARNIVRSLRGEPRAAFRYRDKGMLATIGRAKGIAQFGRFKLSGLLAWLLWLFVHVYFLIGFRNRLLVMMQWAWSYVTYDRGARLITGAPSPMMPAHEGGMTVPVGPDKARS